MRFGAYAGRSKALGAPCPCEVVIVGDENLGPQESRAWTRGPVDRWTGRETSQMWQRPWEKKGILFWLVESKGEPFPPTKWEKKGAAGPQSPRQGLIPLPFSLFSPGGLGGFLERFGSLERKTTLPNTGATENQHIPLGHPILTWPSVSVALASAQPIFCLSWCNQILELFLLEIPQQPASWLNHADELRLYASIRFRSQDRTDHRTAAFLGQESPGWGKNNRPPRGPVFLGPTRWGHWLSGMRSMRSKPSAWDNTYGTRPWKETSNHGKKKHGMKHLQTKERKMPDPLPARRARVGSLRKGYQDTWLGNLVAFPCRKFSGMSLAGGPRNHSQACAELLKKNEGAHRHHNPYYSREGTNKELVTTPPQHPCFGSVLLSAHSDVRPEGLIHPDAHTANNTRFTRPSVARLDACATPARRSAPPNPDGVALVAWGIPNSPPPPLGAGF